MRVPTLPLEPTPLNNKRITVRVVDGALKSGGIFSSSFLFYTIKTDPVGWTIQRKDDDFYFLRTILKKTYPYVVIPPLPVKKKKDSEKSIKRRQKYFTRFLSAVCRSEILKSNKFLVEWLRMTDIKAFAKLNKEEEKRKYVISMQHLISEKGEVQGQMISNSAVFCSKMVDFVDSYQILYNEVIECAKDINEKS